MPCPDPPLPRTGRAAATAGALALALAALTACTEGEDEVPGDEGSTPATEEDTPGDSRANGAEGTPGEPPAVEDGLGAKARDVVEAAEELSADLTRDEFLKRARVRVARVRQAIEDLRLDAEKAGVAAQETWKSSLEDLREKRAQVEESLQRLGSDHVTTWGEAILAFRKLLRELEAAVEATAEKLPAPPEGG